MKTASANPDRLQELETENAELRRQLAERDLVDQQRAADEVVISKKMRCGLSREQAVATIKRQRDFDAAKAKK